MQDILETNKINSQLVCYYYYNNQQSSLGWNLNFNFYNKSASVILAASNRNSPDKYLVIFVWYMEHYDLHTDYLDYQSVWMAHYYRQYCSFSSHVHHHFENYLKKYKQNQNENNETNQNHHIHHYQDKHLILPLLIELYPICSLLWLFRALELWAYEVAEVAFGELLQVEVVEHELLVLDDEQEEHLQIVAFHVLVLVQFDHYGRVSKTF
ncbi:hypothetical protein AGLY_000226 [Aphis glycines]|uniref:Uncharacterized protein n=1 Tax=Aphis glycines TaxID=307491 RepID=A0A6G0U6I4_APHGL|nr:hypothetical protein AGLY_000226 [Aphis glycines]